MHNFRDLKIWQKSIDLTTEVYAILSSFPSEEKFGLISQMKLSLFCTTTWIIRFR